MFLKIVLVLNMKKLLLFFFKLKPNILKGWMQLSYKRGQVENFHSISLVSF